MDLAMSLYRFADAYDLTELKQDLEQYLVKTLDETSVIQVLMLADKFNLQEAKLEASELLLKQIQTKSMKNFPNYDQILTRQHILAEILESSARKRKRTD